MKYFDFAFTYDDNKKRYKSFCKHLHPDKPTGDSKKFIEMRTEWELYEKNYKNQEPKIKVNFNSNYKDSKSYKDLNDLFAKAESECNDEETKELLRKGRKLADNPSIVNLFDLAFDFYKKKKRQ